MKRKKVEKNTECCPLLGDVLELMEPLERAEIMPARLTWHWRKNGMYFGEHGPFPWKCLKELLNLIVDLFGDKTNSKVTAISDAYIGIMERAKTGETKPEDIQILPLIIHEMKRL